MKRKKVKLTAYTFMFLLFLCVFLECAYMDNSTNVSAEEARNIIRDKLAIHLLSYTSKGRMKDALVILLIPSQIIKDEKILYEKSSVQMCGDEIASTLTLTSFGSIPVEIGFFVCKLKKPPSIPAINKKL